MVSRAIIPLILVVLATVWVNKVLESTLPNVAKAPNGVVREATRAPVSENRSATMLHGHDDIVVNRGQQGHFSIDLMVNGSVARFLIDTGASHIIVDPGDARRLGLVPDNSREKVYFRSANGVVGAAPTTIPYLSYGVFEMWDVPAYINDRPMGISLLGLSFLNRFSSYEVQGDQLVIRW